MFDRQVQIYAESHEATNLRAWTKPLFPVAHPNPGTNPAIPIDEFGKLLSQPQVTYPASHVAIEVGQTALHGDPTNAARDLFDTTIEGC